MPTPDEAIWEVAGLTGAAGHLDRPVAAGSWLVPAEVRLDGENVVWSEAFGRLRESGGGLPDRFLSLANPAMVRAFAERWGPLDLVENVRRGLHLERPEHARGLVSNWLEVPEDSIPLAPRREPCALYIALARRFQRVLNQSAEVYTKPSRDPIWKQRFPWHCADCAHGYARAVQTVEDELERLIQIGEVHVAPAWRNGWQIEIGFFSVLGALATQLLLAVARADALYTCTGCGDAYIRSAAEKDGSFRRRRAPKPGENNYCQKCEPRAVQDAKRRYRKKQRDARERYEAGGSVREIARELRTKPGIVARWAKREGWVKGKAAGQG
jgi:hypothetical protein